MENEFKDLDKVKKVLGSDVYEIKTRTNKLTRHAGQLKRLGGMLDAIHPLSNDGRQPMVC